MFPPPRSIGTLAGEAPAIVDAAKIATPLDRIVICHSTRLVSDLLSYMIMTKVAGAQVIQVEAARDIYAAFEPGRPVDFILWGTESIGDGLLRDIDNMCRAHPRLRIALLTADSVDSFGRIPTCRGLSVISSGSMTGPLLISAIGKILTASRLERQAFDDEAPASLAVMSQQSSSPLRSHRMSTRQADVLALLAQGQSNKHIASGLGLSENTVKSHVKNLMRRLGARNRTEAALIGLGALSRAPPPVMAKS